MSRHDSNEKTPAATTMAGAAGKRKRLEGEEKVSVSILSMCEACQRVEIKPPQPRFTLFCSTNTATNCNICAGCFSKCSSDRHCKTFLVCPVCESQCRHWTVNYTETTHTRIGAVRASSSSHSSEEIKPDQTEVPVRYHQSLAPDSICTTLQYPHSTPTAIMPNSCIICRAVASQDILLQYCAQCQSALYCSKACQRIDWRKKQHRQICKLLNVGHGDLQVRNDTHTDRQIEVKESFEVDERSLDEDDKRFFKLFQESTKDGSRAAALEMRKIAKRETKENQKFLLFHSLPLLIRTDSKMLSWPNSPLLVLLQFFDPKVFGNEETSVTPLHHVSNLADPFDYSTHVNQLILAKQLIEHGANVNAVSNPHGTPLHDACHWSNVTNLDFVKLLLEAGADPNSQDDLGLIPLMYTIPAAPGAAKFLLKWPTTDANITTRSGASFLAGVREAVKRFSVKVARPDNGEKVEHQFLLQQWRGIEEMLVERGALDTSITALF
jgi:hypothetical protein